MSTQKEQPSPLALRVVRRFDREYYRQSLLDLMGLFRDVRFRRGLNQAAVSMDRITQEEWYALEAQIKARVLKPSLPNNVLASTQLSNARKP